MTVAGVDRKVLVSVTLYLIMGNKFAVHYQECGRNSVQRFIHSTSGGVCLSD